MGGAVLGAARLRLAALRTLPDYSLIVSHWTSRLCSDPNPRPAWALARQEGLPMSRTIIPLALAASLAFGGAAALAQSSGGSSSGGGAGGGASSGGASLRRGSGSLGGSGSDRLRHHGRRPGAGSAAAPSGSLSPSTSDVTAGSTIPRARTGSELGLPQPGEGVSGTTGSIGPSTGGTLSPETTRQQNNRDRALDRSLLGGSGICQGC